MTKKRIVSVGVTKFNKSKNSAKLADGIYIPKFCIDYVCKWLKCEVNIDRLSEWMDTDFSKIPNIKRHILKMKVNKFWILYYTIYNIDTGYSIYIHEENNDTL